WRQSEPGASNLPKLVFEKHFIRCANKLIKGSPDLDPKLEKILLLLKENPFNPSLKTHALSGNLKGKYACSLTHDLRIIFKLTSETIHLLDIGTHDEVY
ncbi:MAG: type II toxin-antitoxin system YafQ family toxin, partial [Thermodesulfovibrionales bacterium]